MTTDGQNAPGHITCDEHASEFSADERKAAQQRARAALEARNAVATKVADDPFFRAANEDDDGYDPYSDRPETPERYEEDPWR